MHCILVRQAVLFNQYQGLKAVVKQRHLRHGQELLDKTIRLGRTAIKKEVIA
jgi:hypothetical protein